MTLRVDVVQQYVQHLDLVNRQLRFMLRRALQVEHPPCSDRIKRHAFYQIRIAVELTLFNLVAAFQ